MRQFCPSNRYTYLQEQCVSLRDQLETWRPVIGHESYYEVSDMGRLRCLNYRRKGIVVVIKQIKNRGGYMCASLGSERKNVRTHRVVAEAFLGPPSPEIDVNHKNGIKHDNRLENLEYCTKSENCKHAAEMGLRRPKMGESHYRCKFTNDVIREIQRRALSGESQQKLAREFGTKQSCISDIKLGKKWKHVTRTEAVL